MGGKQYQLQDIDDSFKNVGFCVFVVEQWLVIDYSGTPSDSRMIKSRTCPSRILPPTAKFLDPQKTHDQNHNYRKSHFFRTRKSPCALWCVQEGKKLFSNPDTDCSRRRRRSHRCRGLRRRCRHRHTKEDCELKPKPIEPKNLSSLGLVGWLDCSKLFLLLWLELLYLLPILVLLLLLTASVHFFFTKLTG